MSDVPPPIPPPIPPRAVPVQPLGYASAIYNRRPGVLTAVGVASIVLALLGGLTALQSLGSGWAFMAMRGRVPTSMPAPVQPVAPATGPLVTVDGLDEPTRSMVVGQMMQMAPMTADQQRRLDAFLAQEARTLAPALTGEDLAAEDVAPLFSDAGAVPDEDYVRFVTGYGELRVTDQDASFYRSDRSAPLVVADQPQAPSNGARTLTPEEVDAIVAAASAKLLPQKMTDAQTATLRTTLATPNQQLVTGPANSAVTNASTSGDGYVMVHFPGAFVQMDRSGTIISQFNAATFGTGAGPGFRVSSGAATMMFVDGISSALLAILLLVAGILTLRNSARARRLHLVYAIAKIPLVLLGAVASYWLVTSMLGGLRTISSPASYGMMIGIGLFSSLGLIYPIILLFVLNTRRVRDHYNSVSA